MKSCEKILLSFLKLLRAGRMSGCVIILVLHTQLFTTHLTSLHDYREWFSRIPDMQPFNRADTTGTIITDPDFSAYFNAHEPNFILRMLLYMGIGRPPEYLLGLRNSLKALASKYRQKHNRGEARVRLRAGDKIIVFGNLHGSIFSFMRDLTELQEKYKVINDRLELAENCYLVFLGDIINYSPHSFEMLSLITAILEKNGERAYYIKNEQETDGFWLNLSAMRELIKQQKRLWNISLTDDLLAFFEQLPDTVSFRHQKFPERRLVCSGREPKFDRNGLRLTDAIIMGEQWLRLTDELTGLMFTGFEQGVPVWSLISCPNRFYQDIIHFYQDAFMIVDITDSIATSIIEFVHRDMRKKGAFTREYYSLGFGFSTGSEPPRIGREIVEIGSSGILTGSVGAVGRGVKEGVETACVQVSREGGIHGAMVRPIILDDGYLPRIARRNIDYLRSEYDLSMFVSSQGTPTLTAYFDLVKEGKIFLFFPVTGGVQFRAPDVSHIIHYRKTYPQEVECLVDHICKKYDARRFAIVYQNDAFGQQLAAAAHKKLEELGVAPCIDIPFTTPERLLDSQISTVLNSGVDAIGLFFASTVLAEAFLTRVGGGFLIGRHLFGISFLDDILFRRFLTLYGLKFTFSYAVPNPFEDTLEIVREFRQEMAREHHTIDSNGLEGYIAMALFAEGARHVQPPLTGEKIMHWFEGLKNYQFKGLTLTFNPQTRSFELPTWIRTETDQWIAV